MWFYPRLRRESRLLILYSSGRIDLFSTAADTFLQPETNRSVTLPVLGAMNIITAAHLCQQSRVLYVGTFNGSVLTVPLDTLTPDTHLPDCGGPVSAISPLKTGFAWELLVAGCFSRTLRSMKTRTAPYIAWRL